MFTDVWTRIAMAKIMSDDEYKKTSQVVGFGIAMALTIGVAFIVGLGLVWVSVKIIGAL